VPPVPVEDGNGEVMVTLEKAVAELFLTITLYFAVA
jgi:hypothetical protein